MKRYRLEIEGTDLLLDFDGEHAPFSLRAECFVAADSPEQAYKIALARLLQHPQVKERMVDQPGVRPSYRRLAVEEVGRWVWLRRPRQDRVDFELQSSEPEMNR